ncbi:MAG TPA: outer membrane beta-barrel protein [Candidatus Saccharimonadales bacterium]|nr:outer membrane beta-barrel protein [Candidatus Saccharimonadales bacterium]
MRRNNRLWAVLSCCAFSLGLATERGFSQGAYLHAGAGVSLAEKVDLNSFFGPPPGTRIKFDPGIRLSAAGGYSFCPFMAVELETGIIYNNVKRIEGFGEIDAALSHVPMLANLVLRYEGSKCPVIPYVGAGVGGDFSIITLDRVSTESVFADGSDTSLNFAWQAFAGIRYKLNDKMSMGGAYKYYSVDRASWDFGGFQDGIQIGRAKTHSILFDFSMSF